jgi:tRNA pseudouridine38-40 synthase
VHARGQVAHVDLPGPPPARLADRLNALLDADVRVQAVSVAPPGFDARFSALARCYLYRLSDAPAGPPPWRRRDTAWHRRPVAEEPMARAAEPLLGEHDFAAFCRRPPAGAGTVRRLLRLDPGRAEDGVLRFRVEADAFCHGMVRFLVGALLTVGDGRRPVGWPAEMLAAGRREAALAPAPAHGLTLLGVRYPADDELADRAALTRQRRGAGRAPAPGREL